MTRDKLTISFWIYNYYYGCLPGEAYCDLEKCMAEMSGTSCAGLSVTRR